MKLAKKRKKKKKTTSNNEEKQKEIVRYHFHNVPQHKQTFKLEMNWKFTWMKKKQQWLPLMVNHDYFGRIAEMMPTEHFQNWYYLANGHNTGKHFLKQMWSVISDQIWGFLLYLVAGLRVISIHSINHVSDRI